MKDIHTNYAPRKRLLAFIALATFLFCGVFAKLATVVIVHGEEYGVRALEQWMRDVPVQAERGAIVDRNGVVLADTSTLYTVYVRPNSVTDAAATASALSSVLGLDESKVLAAIGKRASEVTIAKNLTKDKIIALVATGASGIYVGQSNLRYYPYGDFMTQLLGFTNSDGDGQTGLEKYYNEYMVGLNGSVLTATDLVGRELDTGETMYVPAVAGRTIYTTLDYYIQRFCENAVEKAMTLNGAKAAYCIAMNPLTGEIYALAEKPSFDLNNVPRDDLTTLFSASKSMSVSSVYEPGSTFKILTAAIALDTGVYNVDSRFYCGGSHVVDGQKIKCWKTKGHGSISFAEGVAGSCNVVFMNSALAVGAEKFYEYLAKFGVFSKTGVDILGETSGLSIALSNVKNVDLARIGFGQAIAVTPIGLLAAACAAINGGTTIKPHVAASYLDVDGTLTGISESGESVRVISEQTSATLRTLLTSVVDGGSGKGAYVEGHTIMGKTGTAQKYENGAIASGKYYSSFLGASMESGKELAILLIVDEPEGAYYGSVVAAPLVGEIFRNVFAYWEGGLPASEGTSVGNDEYPIF